MSDTQEETRADAVDAAIERYFPPDVIANLRVLRKLAPDRGKNLLQTGHEEALLRK